MIVFRGIVTILTTFQSMVEIVLRLYKSNIVTVFDPLLSMIGIIFSECWTDDSDVVKILIVLFFNQL